MKLLMVRLSAMGDVLHTLPALELLRRAAPAAELTWVVERAAAPLLLGHPALDRVVVIDRRGLLQAAGRAGALRGAARAVRDLRVERFDAAIDFQGLLRSAVVARLSRAREVLGPAWAREGARWLYSTGLDVPRPAEAHAVDRACAIVGAALSALGRPHSPAAAPPARLPWNGEGEEGAGGLVLLPGAGKPANRPPPGLLAQVADALATRHPEMEQVLVGGPGDQTLAQQVQERCRVARPRSACGQHDLRGTAGVLARARVVVGGDTGPLHLARTLNRPVVALFCAADPFRTGPAGLPGAAPVRVLRGEAPCAPCRAGRCKRPDRVRICLRGMPSVAVVQAIEDLICSEGGP